ncbi:MAG: triacylglycerol lipase [Lachnospiraceae bacterium]|nr:triacylglycerol lipase [Lachnospiraceae bacterium]
MIAVNLVAVIGIAAAAGTYYIVKNAVPGAGLILAAGWLVTVLMVISPDFLYPQVMSRRLKILRNGLNLLVLFCMSILLLLAFAVKILLPLWMARSFDGRLPMLLKSLLVIVLVMSVVFFSGMIRVYISSEQLGIKWRLIGLLCGMIPIVHLILLFKIIIVSSRELDYENLRLINDMERADEKLCDTVYPVLLVHGVFFRDFKYFNYWGRIPKALESNGAVLYYGEHQSAASVEDCGRELAARIKDIVTQTGCGKLNVIAHSKGGLDMRYAISECGADKYVASLTTINTPHRGCEFADYLLDKIPAKEQQLIADAYNDAFKNLGDEHPDFMAAVTDLTHSVCALFNEKVKDVPGVLYQSIGSKLNKGSSGRFPLNMSYLLVSYFDGDNDGLVGKDSFEWGSSYRYLTVRGNRGISHGDMIDLNRENIPEFDVREFYIRLVNDLKKAGL